MALIAMCLTVTMEVYPSSVNVQLEYFDRACSVDNVKSHTSKVYIMLANNFQILAYFNGNKIAGTQAVHEPLLIYMRTRVYLAI